MIAEARAACVERDGWCRIRRIYMSEILGQHRAWLVFVFGSCAGSSEFAHYNATHRRSKTRGLAPEERHTRAHAMMLCSFHSQAYDQHRMDIEETDPSGCDGRLRITRGDAVYEEKHGETSTG